MANIIPEGIRLFDVYIDGSAEPGIAEGEFPSIEYETNEIKGAGIAGTIEAVVPGLFGSITFTLKWRYPPKNFFELAKPTTHDIDLYADMIAYDGGTGQTVTKQLHAYIKAQTKHYNIGSMTTGESMDGETEHEVIYMKIDFDGKTQIELDKLNYKYVILSTDYLQASRKALGRS